MKINRPTHAERQYRRGFRQSPRHSGIDYGWIIGQEEKSREVLACATGIVRSVYDGGGYHEGWGNRIEIDHTTRAYSAYSHNATGSAKVKKGQAVQALDVIASQGDTGNADGIHLHFELYIDGVRVDPAPYLAGKRLPGTPVIPRRMIAITPTLQINLRKSANLKGRVTRKLNSGDTGTFDAYKHGEKVTQNGVTSDVWFRAAFGRDWAWSGNFTNRSTEGMKRVR